jgi:hypothetical protein
MTQTPPAGDRAPRDISENSPEQDGSEHGPKDGSKDRSEVGSGSGRPTDDELLQHLGAAVLLCWNELSFSSQLKILAQTNDVIGTKPIPEARNEIVKLLLRHTKM